MKKIALIFVLFLSACGVKPNNEKVQIYTTLFPQYDFASVIGNDDVEVHLILPPGVDGHDFELTPQLMKEIENSDLFIYTSDAMEPWVSKIKDSLISKGVKVVDASTGVRLIDDEHGEGSDPHIWLDLDNAQIMVNNVYEGLAFVKPENAEAYLKQTNQLLSQMQELDDRYFEMTSNSKHNTIVFVGHFALNYLVSRYELDYIAAYSGSIEPSAKDIRSILDYLKTYQLNTVFVEEMTESSVADLIKNETGANLLELHSLHNVTKEQLKAGIHFMDLMEMNYLHLKEGLNE